MITHNYANVPVRRNYRTNIYGNILTEEANFNVEIIPAFDGWYDVYSEGIHADYGFNHDLIVTNSTINGFSTYCNGAGIVRFTDCTFGANDDGDAFMNIRKKTEFIRCNFKDGFGIDVIGGCQVTLKNCYVGETLITAANIATLLGEDPANVTIANN